MSGAGTPPETGTFAASDDRYNGNMTFGAPTELDQTNSMMPGQPNDIFKGMPANPAPQSPLFNPQPMAEQNIRLQSNVELAKALNATMTQVGAQDTNQSDQAALIQTANQLGIAPRDLAAAISYETGGKFDPNIQGGKGGLYRGLIQFGPEEQQKYGIRPGMSFAEQMPAVGAFLRDRGVRPGADVATIYRTINGGNPNASLNASDGNGTIAQHIERIRAGHYGNADAFLSRAPEFGDTGYQLEPNAPDFKKVPIRYKAKLAEVSNMQNPISPAQPQFGDRGYNLTPLTPEFKGMDIPFGEQLAALNSPIPNAGAQAQDPLESMDFQVAMPPKNAIPSQMFDPQTTFTRAKGLYTPAPTSEPNMSPARAFPAFESNIDLSNTRPAYETPVADIPFAERTHLQKLDSAVRAVNQLARGTMNAGTGAVYGLGQAAGAVIALPSRMAGFGGGEADRMYNFFTDLREAAQRGNADITGLSGQGAAPQSGLEKLALNTGESVTPMGRFTIPLTAGLTAYREGLDIANAAPKKDLGNFAGMLSPGNIDVSAPTQPINVVYVPQDDGTIVVAPSSSVYGKINLPPEKAIEQYNRVGAFYGHFQNEGDAHLFVDAINDRVRMPVMTIGGPSKVSTSELALMGTMGAFSIGAAFAPQVFSMMSRSTPKLGRTVADAAPGTQAFSTRGDYLASTVYDINAGPMRIAGRQIQDPVALKDINDVFTLQTRGAASNIADSAVRNGVSQGPNFTFQVKVPLATLQEKTSPQIEQYLNLRDTFDDILSLDRARANLPAKAQAKAAAAGPITVRGFTEQDVLRQMGALERTNPEVKQAASLYYDNLTQLRKFEKEGEFATVSPKEFKRLQAENPNEVPFVGDKRIWEASNYQRQSPFVALGETMRTNMRFRMENEARGMYIDAFVKEYGDGTSGPAPFVRVTSKQLDANDHWNKNTVKIYRKGKPEYYTTDPFIADVLKMDPYYFQSKAVNALYTTKRIVEHATTGMFAPFFANTSFLRNFQIIKPTAATIPGVRAPNIGQAIMGIPQQLGPQLAHYGAGPNVVKTIYNGLDRGSGGWLSKVFGPQFVQSLSARLQTIHNDSLIARLEAAGSHRGSILEHQIRSPSAVHWQRLTQTNNRILDGVINGTKGATRTFFEGWKNTFGAVHNAPSYAFARRNEGRMPLPQLAGMTRQMTGDPMSGGQLTNAGKTIRFQDSNFFDVAKTKAAQTVGGLAEFGRAAVPWFNPSVQGMRRLGQAYLENPKRFVANAWIYTQLPAAVAYSWNKSLGNDPQGRSYSDYHMNGRSQYNTLMNYYLAIPGQPVERGIQIPRFHELAPMARWMEIAMDHAFRSNNFTAAEDFRNVAANGVKVIFGPAMPPLGNVAFAGAGMVGPQGAFEGDAYKRKDQPFDQNAGLPANVELYMRAIAPGLADVFGAGISAAIQAEEGKSRVGAFLEEGAKRAISKDPVWRAITGIQPPATGNTRITEELFAKQKAISDLDRFYQDWGLTGGPLELKGRIPGARSQAGDKIVRGAMGNPLPRNAPGLGQPEPTNPLYVMFAKEIHDKFKKDDPKNGGIGFQSMWKRYTEASTAIRTLQKTSAGNFVTWQNYLEAKPDAKQFLQDAGVDYRNPTAVRSFYESYRQAAAKQILFTIRAVEQEFSQRLGRPIKLENLDPYNKDGLPPKEEDYDLTTLGFDQQNPP